MARFALFLFSVFLLYHHHLVTSQSESKPKPKPEPEGKVLSEQKTALLYFKGNVTLTRKYNDSWKDSEHLCNWKGVFCDATNSSVKYLRLPGAVGGKIPPETIGKLLDLTVLSLRSNLLYGPLPDDFSDLKSLKTLALNNNNFSGPLPNLELENFNFSVNRFSGPIPTSFSKSPASLFSLNPGLCGHPLQRPCKNGTQPAPAEPQPDTSPKKKNKEKGVIVGVSIGSAFLLLILLCFIKKKINKPSEQPPILPSPLTLQKSASASRAGTSTTEGKLVFLDTGIYRFDLEDLYQASPEILGKGSFGTSYKVVLDGGTTTVVVKRLKDVGVTKNEFESRMEVLGKMKNQHLVALKAFYYSKDEKLLVRDYLPGGSLSACLHGSKGSGRTLLDWGQRMRIGLSAARGVAYLHEVGKLVHGDIKSSNILLQQEDGKDAFVSDFGLNTLLGPSHHIQGYLAPEVLEDQKLTFESDVYSFGILLLELLTGKAPNHALVGGDLPRWVQHNTNIREEWKADVFDVELRRFQNVELEMVQLLKIAMECVSTMPNQRPSIHDVVRKIEDLNQSEFDDTSVEPSKGSNSHTPSTDSHTPFIEI